MIELGGDGLKFLVFIKWILGVVQFRGYEPHLWLLSLGVTVESHWIVHQEHLMVLLVVVALLHQGWVCENHFVHFPSDNWYWGPPPHVEGLTALVVPSWLVKSRGSACVSLFLFCTGGSRLHVFLFEVATLWETLAGVKGGVVDVAAACW